MNAPALPKMNVGEFLAWSERQPDDRHELVDGTIVAMTRDTVRHNLTKFAAKNAPSLTTNATSAAPLTRALRTTAISQ
jgi:Uma2 family endonuclease